MTNYQSVNETKKPLIREWYAVQEELARLKQKESELRKAVYESLDVDPSVSGTTNYRLSDLHKITVTIPTSISVDPNGFRDNYQMLKQRGLIGDTSVIKMKPDVSVTAYKHMSDADKAQFGHLFKVKAGSPSVKITTLKD